jgi:hypothetical protein
MVHQPDALTLDSYKDKTGSHQRPEYPPCAPADALSALSFLCPAATEKLRQDTLALAAVVQAELNHKFLVTNQLICPPKLVLFIFNF